MGWKIRIGSTGFGDSMNADVITYQQCSITSNSCHTVAQFELSPNADRTTLEKAGSNPAWRTEQVWQHVLSTLVGID